MLSILTKALLPLVITASSAIAGQMLDEAAFTKFMIARMISQGIFVKQHATESFQLVLEEAGKVSTVWNLDNAYARYKSTPESLDQVVDDFVSVAKELKAPHAEVATLESLLPAVRDLEYIRVLQSNATEFEGELKNDELAVLPLFGDLGIVLAFDNRASTVFATWQNIEDLGIKRNDALALALRNFENLEIKPEIYAFDGFVGIDSGGSYQSTLLLSETFWDSNKFLVNGDLVAFPVSRDVMLVTGSSEVAGLKAAQEMATKWIDQNAYPMSSLPIVRRNGKWGVFVQ